MARGKIVINGVIRADIVRLLEEGLPDDEIMNQTGWCPALVQRIRHRMGIKHERYLTRPELFSLIARVINSNQPFMQLASETGCSHTTVSTIAAQLRDVGINVPDRKTGRPKGQS